MKILGIISLSISLLIITLLGGCACIKSTRSISKVYNGTMIMLPSSQIPCESVSDYETAAEMALDAIFSNDFELKLQDFMETSLDHGQHVPSWQGVEVESILSSMRRKINGTYAETYGGARGYFLHIVYGNIAYDGSSSGPIRLNRWPLRTRTIPDVANTIAHEVAHRAGYTHPHSNIALSIANLEPPYVIGKIVGEIVAEKLDAQ